MRGTFCFIHLHSNCLIWWLVHSRCLINAASFPLADRQRGGWRGCSDPAQPCLRMDSPLPTDALFQFYRGGDWHSKRLRVLSEVTQLVRNQSRSQTELRTRLSQPPAAPPPEGRALSYVHSSGARTEGDLPPAETS